MGWSPLPPPPARETPQSGGDEFSRSLVMLAERRKLAGGMYQSWCQECRCSMKVDAATLRDELSGDGPYCHTCTGLRTGSYGGSPQESHDIAYHGGRYHSGEW